MSQRVRNVSISRPILYGSIAIPITKKDPQPEDPSHTHRWTVYVKDASGEDMSHFIKKVSFKLHDSFVPPVRGILSTPFSLFYSTLYYFDSLFANLPSLSLFSLSFSFFSLSSLSLLSLFSLSSLSLLSLFSLFSLSLLPLLSLC
jgi:hypothetical protein